MPVRDKHHYSAPFMGCFLVGDYTTGAMEQLRSLGFHLLYFTYPTIIEAFAVVGIDAQYDEATSDEEFASKQEMWDELDQGQRDSIWNTLLELNKQEISTFMEALEKAVKRQIDGIRLIPLHGTSREWRSIQAAIEFVESYEETGASDPLHKYEVQIRYDNGDRIEGQFSDKESVIDFLQHYTTGNWTPMDSDGEE